MTDVYSSEKRSDVMRQVKGQNTKPEQRVASMLREAGVAFTQQADHLPGKPDFLIESAKLVVFVHGCFWHGHDCPRGARVPKQNRSYWLKKIAGNRRRDRRHAKHLRAMGYSVYVIWECQLKSRGIARVINRALRGSG